MLISNLAQVSGKIKEENFMVLPMIKRKPGHQWLAGNQNDRRDLSLYIFCIWESPQMKQNLPSSDESISDESDCLDADLVICDQAVVKIFHHWWQAWATNQHQLYKELGIYTLLLALEPSWNLRLNDILCLIVRVGNIPRIILEAIVCYLVIRTKTVVEKKNNRLPACI